jgi:hypothetical protein
MHKLAVKFILQHRLRRAGTLFFDDLLLLFLHTFDHLMIHPFASSSAHFHP